MKIKSSFLIVSLLFLVACSSSDETSNVQSTQEPSATTKSVDPEIEVSVPKSELTPIPMSDSFENGRYFLISHITESGLENVEYMRKSNDNISYGKMEIRCSDNQIRKYSADNADALQSANMGDWITPSPDWTDQDIVNFICKK